MCVSTTPAGLPAQLRLVELDMPPRGVRLVCAGMHIRITARFALPRNESASTAASAV
jgi:hypothetical protein